MTTRTAITCPQHSSCVCMFISVPKAELNGRRPLRLPDEYRDWVAAQTGVVVAVEHHPSPTNPDGLLVGDLIIAPRDIGDRTLEAERGLARHQKVLEQQGTSISSVNSVAYSARSDLMQLRADFVRARREHAEWHEGMAQIAAYEKRILQHRLDELEAFVTRRKRWKKKWDKRGEA